MTDFSAVVADIKKAGLAARRFERDGHRQFRDCITVGRNGRLLFQRFSYGEAASLVFQMWAVSASPGGAIVWDYACTDYSGKTEAPTTLADYRDGVLVFEGDRFTWPCAAALPTWKQGGLGRLGMLFSR